MANITSRPNANHPTIGDYSIGDAFDGNYGIVRIGSRLSTGERVVIKELDLSNSTQAKIEGDIMSKLKHPNIVELYDRFEQGNRLYLAMQYAEGGDLLEEISTSPNGMLPVASAKRIFVQLIQALEHMHKNNIVHLDVKPENVFLDANKNVLLGDFGLSSFYDPNSRSFDAVAGTVHYAAPEAYLESVIYGPELDVWSAGVVLYVMLRGRYPFWGETDNETATAILLAQPFWPEWFPEDAIDLLNKIFVKNQRKRITLSKIKRHPFVKAEFRALRASARLSASKALAPIVTAASLGLPKLTLTGVMSPRQRLVPQLAGVIGISPRFNPALVRPLSPTCAATTTATGSSLKPVGAQAPLKHNGREEVMVA